jgi:ABC-type multidrug transport system ATPase subunit
MRPSSAADAMLDVIDTGDGAPKAAIETRRLVKRFGRADALNGLDLRVPQGAVYALLGRNGAGKSTLIQLLMGMLEPTWTHRATVSSSSSASATSRSGCRCTTG